MNNFSKFSYGVRALSVSALLLTASYNELKNAGVFDAINNKVTEVKQKRRNKKLQKMLNKVESKNPVIEDAIKNTYYSECFKNN